MSFELYKGAEKSGAIPAGCVSIARSGMARFNARDLADAGIDQTVTILLDRDERRLAVRAPRKGEPVRRVTIDGKRGPLVSLGGPLLALGLKAADVTGWKDILIDEGQILIQL